MILETKHICQIACGGLHCAALSEDGKVYTWGCSDDGMLGRIGDESSPIMVDIDDGNMNIYIIVLICVPELDQFHFLSQLNFYFYIFYNYI